MVIVLICSRRFRNNNWVDGGGYDIGSAISPTEPSAMISPSENNVVCSSRKPQTWRNDQLFNETMREILFLKAIIKYNYNTILQQSHNLQLLKLKSNLIRCQTLLILDELRRSLRK
jgi:hypothetical protein